MPDGTTRKAIGELLPVIEIDRFGEQKEQVAAWLREVVRVRTSVEQIKPEEWRTILSERIPSVVSEEKALADQKDRDRIKRWYTACLESVSVQDNIPRNALNDVPLLCRKGDGWKYITDETRWLSDDNEVAEAFESDIWQMSLPEGPRKAARKYFGLKPLSRSVRTELVPGQSGGHDDELQSGLRKALPYVFVWRSFKSRQDSVKLRSELEKLQVCILNDLRAKLTIEGVGCKEIKKDWGVKNHTLLIVAGEGSRESFLAQALADFLDATSDAEFYENLLRCGSDDDRRKKLLSNNVPPDEIDRLLREYREEPVEPPGPEDESGVVPVLEPVPRKQPEQPRGSVPPPAPSPPPPGSGPSLGPPPSPPSPLRLKDPRTAPIDLATDESAPGAHGESGGGGTRGGPTGGEDSQLSHDEKLEIERCGSCFAKRKLEENGWDVEEMPHFNPGFDLKATKDGQELRIEVKSHRGPSLVVELTIREYKEYVACEKLSAVTWQLWNVENVETAAPTAQVTCYEKIPEEAFQVGQLSVDLRQCRRLTELP